MVLRQPSWNCTGIPEASALMEGRSVAWTAMTSDAVAVARSIVHSRAAAECFEPSTPTTIRLIRFVSAISPHQKPSGLYQQISRRRRRIGNSASTSFRASKHHVCAGELVMPSQLLWIERDPDDT